MTSHRAVEFISLVALMTGSALVLDSAPWFSRRPLAHRLEPYARGSRERTTSALDGLRQLLTPSVERFGQRLTTLTTPLEPLADRLEFIESGTTPEQMRIRQVGGAVMGSLTALALVLAVRPAPLLSAFLVIVATVAVPVSLEQSLNSAVRRRRHDLLTELPVVVEQLGMLLGAGYSVTGAITRLASRSHGIAAADLRRVIRRVGHGLSEQAALSEWADRSGSDAVRRLVGVLALRREAGDLGALISEEARSIRAEAHRDLIEEIERRAQLVWIPVTVATLVPGLVLLAVPFMSALNQVAGGG